MEILTIKILGGVLLWACMVIFGLLPIFNRHFKTNSCVLFVCNCFCGGLFLSIGLIHILPQAYNMLDGMPMTPPGPAAAGDPAVGDCSDIGIKWSFLVCMCSFSAILFLDKVIFNNVDLAKSNGQSYLRRQSIGSLKNSVSGKSTGRSFLGNDDGDGEHEFKEIVSSKYKIALRLSRNSNLRKESFGDSFDREIDGPTIKKPKLKLSKVQRDSKHAPLLRAPQPTTQEQTPVKSRNPPDDHPDLPSQDSLPAKNNFLINQEPSNNSLAPDQDSPSLNVKMHEGHQHRNLVSKNDSFLTCVILLVAMGIHGFFSLLAFGIESTKKGTINLFIALIVHKWSEALTVGKAFDAVFASRTVR